MANIIDHGVREDLPDLAMSNGLTAVFIDVLAIALSALATSENEKRIAVWIASHDQAIYGSGFAGFSVCEAPWDPRTFASDKRFLLNAVQAAARKLEWNKLDYSPQEDLLLEALQQFDNLVEHFSAEHVVPEARDAWMHADEPKNFERCKKHAVYLHADGCVLCNGG